MNEYHISIIIPCYNEEDSIYRCLRSLELLEYPKHLLQVLVIDNGSKDRSRKIAKKFPVQVFEKEGGTIGAVRNFGANVAKGKILAFLDADCSVSKDWVMSFLEYFKNENTSVGIVGAPPRVPSDGNIIQRAWFSHRKENFIGQDEYVGSANLILPRKLFCELEGFDENIPSGEDFDLCSRVKKKGYTVISDYRIVSYHYGYPSNLIDFMKREIWHGKGMTVDFNNPLKSKPLMLSFLYLIFNFLIVFFVAMFTLEKDSIFLYIVFILLGVELLPVILFSFKKSIQKGSFAYFMILAFLYYLYGMSRSYSLLWIAYKWLCRKIKFQ